MYHILYKSNCMLMLSLSNMSASMYGQLEFEQNRGIITIEYSIYIVIRPILTYTGVGIPIAHFTLYNVLELFVQ